MANAYEEKFKMENGKVLYEGQHLYDENGVLIFDTKYEIKENLGGGANGITFLGKHNFLNINQVIKVYFPVENEEEKEKNIFEIQKNANMDLNSINAINHDGGLIFSPEKMYYSIMRSVENHVTLREWIVNRDKYFEIAKKKYDVTDRPIQYVYSESLNMAISLYKNLILKNSHNVVHGDLHVDNILVSNEFPTPEEWNEYKDESEKEQTDFTLHYANRNFKGVIGTLTEVPCVFIDMGTSQYSKTNKNIGISREIDYLYENTRKIMKPFFCDSKVSFKKICPIHVKDVEEFYLNLDLAHDQLPFPDEVERVSNLLKQENEILNYFTINYSRIILFYNHMFGCIGVGGKSIDDDSDINSLNLYIAGDFLRDYRYCYDRELLSVLDIISNSNEAVYSFRNIQWEEVWNYFEKYFDEKVLGNYIIKNGKMIIK